jgi:uncharacterized membrane protein YccC
MMRWKGMLIWWVGCGRRFRPLLCFATHDSTAWPRVQATCVSFALCLPYLWLLPANVAAMGILLAAGTLVMVLLDRREDIITTAVTTIVVMVVAVRSPAEAWQQPLLRLFDTVIGVAIGVGGKWIASFVFYKARGEPVR